MKSDKFRDVIKCKLCDNSINRFSDLEIHIVTNHGKHEVTFVIKVLCWTGDWESTWIYMKTCLIYYCVTADQDWFLAYF